MKERYSHVYIFFIVTILIITSPHVAAENNRSLQIKIIEKTTDRIIDSAQLVINEQIKSSYRGGYVSFNELPKDKPFSVDILYWDRDIRRIESFHQIPWQDKITLSLPKASLTRREVVFSLSLPFGVFQGDAKAFLLLPQLAYETGGINFGHFGGIRLYEDQLQTDGNISLMVVALDEKLRPWKYGYFLDKNPTELYQQNVNFAPPFSTNVNNEAVLLKWRKSKDAIDPSDINTKCDFKEPPYTDCGLMPQRGGVFSWTNIKRKGQLFHSPGVFLPSRTQGANPAMPLPDSQIELVGHDEPLGFPPFNYARHRFLRFDEVPQKEVNLTMPELLIGTAKQQGMEAILLDSKNMTLQFNITSAGSDDADLKNMDWAVFEAIWVDKETEQKTIWHQFFSPKAGNNTVHLNYLPASFNTWMPDEHSNFVNLQVWIYGTDSINGYGEALKYTTSERDPLLEGKDAFRVTRWR